MGKTLLAKALARTIGGAFHRVQCTPDLLPSELTGVSVFHLAGNEWEFRPGPLFAHVVLVDELNRATPRTQSALLEAMEERQVTVDGVTRDLPQPFFLVATQNPFETTGTFPLVEGQLDRFSVVTHIGPPDPATERELLLGAGGEDALAHLTPVSDPVALASAMATVRRIHCDPSVADYVISVANATRTSPDVSIGASPRASLALLHAAQAHALLDGRGYVVPDDVKRARGSRARAPPDAARPGNLARGPGVPRRARRRRPGSAPVRSRLPAPTSLSRPGAVLGVVAGAIYVIARSTGAGWDIVLLCALVAVLLTGAVWPGVALVGVRAHVDSPRDATVGRTLRLGVELTGRARGVRVRVSVDPTSVSEWTRADVPCAGATTVTPCRRGVFSDLLVEVRSSSPLGLVGWRRWIAVPLAHPVEVAPRPLPLRVEPVLGVDRAANTLPGARATGLEVTRGVREYVDGDPIRLVHWPATARTGTVMVRELEGPQRPRLVVVVDLRGPEADAEVAASRASGGLALGALGNGTIVDLVTVEAVGPRTGTVTSALEIGRRLARAVPGPPTLGPVEPGAQVRHVRAGAPE